MVTAEQGGLGLRVPPEYQAYPVVLYILWRSQLLGASWSILNLPAETALQFLHIAELHANAKGF